MAARQQNGQGQPGGCKLVSIECIQRSACHACLLDGPWAFILLLLFLFWDCPSGYWHFCSPYSCCCIHSWTAFCSPHSTCIPPERTCTFGWFLPSVCPQHPTLSQLSRTRLFVSRKLFFNQQAAGGHQLNRARAAAAVSADVAHADTKFTALLSSTARPPMGDTSGPGRPVSFLVRTLTPVNWMVAPSRESMREPARPAATPSATSCHWRRVGPVKPLPAGLQRVAAGVGNVAAAQRAARLAGPACSASRARLSMCALQQTRPATPPPSAGD